MSWQAYVDNNLVGSKCITKAAIFGIDGSKWAASGGFNVTPDEAKKLAAAFKDPTGIRASGLYLSGQKYFALKADDRSIYAKQVRYSLISVDISVLSARIDNFKSFQIFQAF
jgi:profilin